MRIRFLNYSLLIFILVNYLYSFNESIITFEERKTEVNEKLKRVYLFLEKNKLDGILLSTVRNFAWMTGGGDSHIVITSEIGCAPLLILKNGKKYLIASNSESSRLMNEALKGLGFELREFKWFEEFLKPNRKLEIIKSLTSGMKIGSDIPFPGTVLVANEFSKIRYQLTDCEIKKYRWLGFQCAQAVKEVCYKIKPGMSEKQIEALTSDALMRRGIRPTVILIGTDERIYNYRHATPTEKKLKKYAMINICAEKWGLVIAMTRLVHFGPLPKDLKKKMQSVARVDSTYLSMTRPGMPAFKILEAGQKAYEAEGYKDEWKAHHQGGAIGYLEREWIVYPGLKEKVRERQAFAWNPTIRGTKCEDTIICFKDRIEILTEIKDWPKIRVTIDGKTFYRPGILIRKK